MINNSSSSSSNNGSNGKKRFHITFTLTRSAKVMTETRAKNIPINIMMSPTAIFFETVPMPPMMPLEIQTKQSMLFFLKIK